MAPCARGRYRLGHQFRRHQGGSLDAITALGVRRSLRFTFVLFPAIFFLKRPPVPWKNLAGYGLLIGTASVRPCSRRSTPSDHEPLHVRRDCALSLVTSVLSSQAILIWSNAIGASRKCSWRDMGLIRHRPVRPAVYIASLDERHHAQVTSTGGCGARRDRSRESSSHAWRRDDTLGTWTLSLPSVAGAPDPGDLHDRPLDRAPGRTRPSISMDRASALAAGMG